MTTTRDRPNVIPLRFKREEDIPYAYLQRQVASAMAAHALDNLSRHGHAGTNAWRLQEAAQRLQEAADILGTDCLAASQDISLIRSNDNDQ